MCLQFPLFEWEILLGLFCCYSMIMYCEGRGYRLSFRSQSDIPTGIISRPDEEGCISPKGLRFGNKITGTMGGEFTLSPLGQCVYVCGEE